MTIASLLPSWYTPTWIGHWGQFSQPADIIKLRSVVSEMSVHSWTGICCSWMMMILPIYLGTIVRLCNFFRKLHKHKMFQLNHVSILFNIYSILQSSLPFISITVYVLKYWTISLKQWLSVSLPYLLSSWLSNL